MTDISTDRRGPGRPSRDDAARRESLARAEARAREIRSSYAGSEGGIRDKFYAPPAPDGWTYEWKVRQVIGMDMTSTHRQQIDAGWTAVPASRHPEMMPPGWQGDTIELEGMMLMERPEVLTLEARARDKREAEGAVRSKEQQLGLAPRGQFDRDPSRVKVSKSYAPIPIPADE